MQIVGVRSCLTYPLFTLFPKSGSPRDFPSMPTLPSVNHYREESLPLSVPDPSIDPHPRAASSSSINPTTTDPPALQSTFTGSVVGSISRRNRRSFAALAQRTSSAFASLSTIATPTTTLRTSDSSTSLSRQSKPASINPLTPPLSDEDTHEQLNDLWRPYSPELFHQKRRLTLQRIPTPPQETRPVQPGVAPIAPSTMHQTSSRLLRMTEDERPFTKVGRDKDRG